MKIHLPIILLIFIISVLFVYLHNPQSVKISSPLTTNQQSVIPNYDHIVIVVLENKGYDRIIGSKNAPYLNSLATENSLSKNYYALVHPSLPNYLALLGGSTFGITSDCINCFLDQINLVDRIEDTHRNWKAYMESMPSPCFVGNSPPYAQKHNPFIYFNNIRNNPERCKNIVPYSELSTDLVSPLTPNFIWITPDLCHDMHDCSIKAGDDWLSKEIPIILNSPIFKLQKSLLVITYDEAEVVGQNRIPTILVGSNVKQKFVSLNKYTHYSLLKTIETSWNLSPLTENDKNATGMIDFFNP